MGTGACRCTASRLSALRRTPSFATLVQLKPEAMWAPDQGGRLPIHHAAARHMVFDDGSTLDDDLELARLVVELRPDALRHQDASGNLPLHAALSSPTASLAKVRVLMEPYPKALRVGNAAGQLPVHVALSAESPDVGIVQFPLE